MSPPNARNAAFGSTHWSLVLAASELSDPRSREALAELVEAYWYPLYVFARRRGNSVEDASDLTQGFFASLLEKNGLRTVEQGRGRFRSYLLGAFRHFVANDHARATAEKRGAGVSPVSLDFVDAEARYGREPVADSSPEAIYQRRWALTVLDRGLGKLRAECEAAGKGGQFAELKEFLTGESARGGIASAAERLGMSAGAARVAVHRLRKRFGDLLKAEIAATVERPEEVDAELRHLLSVLRA